MAGRRNRGCGCDEIGPYSVDLFGRGFGALWVALKAEDPSTVAAFQTLDQPPGLAVRPGARPKTRRQRRHHDGLVVEGVHLQLQRGIIGVFRGQAVGGGARHRATEPAGRVDLQVVCVRRPLPIGRAGVVGHILKQLSAGEDVDGLETATNPEHRQRATLGFAPRRQLERVADRVDLAGAVHRLAVHGRIDVGAARQQQPVHGAEEAVPFRRRSAAVEQRRCAAVAGYPGRIQLVLASGQVGVVRAGRIGHGDDDERECCGTV